ncbi:hypothetical protein EUTSA_v10014968mg [Eutrema salsugineum]|uniref:Viral late gene transcription factor 3 zinc ribbon domain-containing protein n=1 Tax=Eutrema salsugineum TaxID=72664 RepID=V4KY03_EUTSA|nr:uncharacterized protein LOC18018499 [Eutrema salsugineum]ESQ42890.1 hypothetical protein EUTSA_v10014968mg [Eutrema salsugineum]
MEASSSSLCRVPSLWTVGSRPRQMKSTASFVSPVSSRGRSHGLMVVSTRRLGTPSALGELADTVVETGKSEITWQIIVGTIAGVTPFVVAGVEFSKRIIAQKRCEECKGSGLVFRDKKYFRCPGCGGFLPWQSWRRFFTG